MRVAIFFDKPKEETASAIKKIISDKNCDVVEYCVEDVWDENKCKNPISLLHEVTHILFIYSIDPVTDAAFIFFSGFASGKGIQIFLLQSGGTVSIPKNCSHLVAILTVNTFEQYFIAEQKRFTELEKKQRARFALLEKGYPCFDANFIAAVIDGDAEIISLFLEAGFNASLRDACGTPVLSLAVRNSQQDAVALLITQGANVDLTADDRQYSALMDAAQLGNTAIAKILLEAGANPDVKSKDGQTALVLAVGKGDLPMIKILAKYKANPSISDNLGLSALGYAKLFQNKEIISLLESIQQ
ncbi:ankyrin repeat domain-containing protein [Treponema phagedenis]|uniref:Ankyrin repeat domain-containing protein n=1 Tax=Treponema phagedenis TaxID=162 RepID=A0AAE6IT85_TREPH|nr:ankyrin repeat domain-containing protein [Treponema phagedenis]NVP25402.1 ankyrin repeat domain-containing protein [Treponema phagedenis]QEJ94894.1 ankyrin repeat domain-containing protein [Treponema phagedenis]QEJ97879.1 ankyrin repeat domain-containing protein [Treponema phagedenis]QEK00795.1 ankyrin repeat domain-containing protein [Treponema phagedenis]QEK03446.1 ankyrin repeat domain-containing protein [Treponema phagedenis]